MRGFGRGALVVGISGAVALITSVALLAFDLDVVALIFLMLFGLSVLGLLLLNRRLTNVRAARMHNKVHELLLASSAAASIGTNAVLPGGKVRLTRETPGDSAGYAGLYFGVGPDYDYAHRLLNGGNHIESYALRSKSFRIRTAYARAATNMQFGLSDLLRLIRTEESGIAPRLSSHFASWRPAQLMALSRVIANQSLIPTDPDDAAAIISFVTRRWGQTALSRSDAYIAAETFASIQDDASALTALKVGRIGEKDPVHWDLFRANLVLPADPGSATGYDLWLRQVNDLFAKHGVTPIELTDLAGAKSPYDSIRAQPAGQADGPLVTVIVPTFEGADQIETAIRSLRSQTWKNLEIIIIDDASSDSTYRALQERYARLPGITLLRQEHNQGAYAARNAGLKIARGEFITVHDDDDWSHPQKIEQQATHLVESPDAVANMSLHVRTTESLRFTRINNNPSFAQPNYSSLMIRRSVFEALGNWDLVTKGADAEFRDRLVTAYGRSVDVVGQVPLSFTRIRESSLTSGEFGRGYIDPSRLFYQAAYLQAHGNAHDGAPESLHIDNLRIARPFNMEIGHRDLSREQFDVAFMTDFRFSGGTSSLTLNEVEATADRGLRVALIHVESPLNSTRDPIQPRALRLAQHPNVKVLSLRDTASIALLVIRHPSLLQYADNISSNLRVGRTVVVINNAPTLRNGKTFNYDVFDVAAHARKIFGDMLEIRPESAVTRAALLSHFPSKLFSENDWPGFIDTRDFTLRTPDFARKPVVGRHSRDTRSKWPTSPQTIIELYSSNDTYDVSILGGIQSIDVRTRSVLEESATVHGYGSLTPQEFLSGIDFWVYYHADEARESFGMAALEAIASGVVVILPHYMRATFGPAGVYASPGQVGDVVRNLWMDPSAYRKQTAEAIRFIEDRYSRTSLNLRIDDMLPR